MAAGNVCRRPNLARANRSLVEKQLTATIVILYFIDKDGDVARSKRATAREEKSCITGSQDLPSTAQRVLEGKKVRFVRLNNEPCHIDGLSRCPGNSCRERNFIRNLLSEVEAIHSAQNDDLVNSTGQCFPTCR